MSNYIINPFFEFGQPVLLTRNAWRQLGRTVLGAPSDNIVVNVPNSRWYMILSYFFKGGGFVDSAYRINGDSGFNYANRFSVDGTADTFGTGPPTDHGVGDDGFGDLFPSFRVDYLDNRPTAERLLTGHVVHQTATGPATSPRRTETIGKWSNSLDQITSIALRNDSAGNYQSGSEVVVLGFDPKDGLDASANFWRELVSTTTIDPSGEFMEVSFTPKKYLWVQWSWLTLPPTNAVQCNLRLGTTSIDVGSNYSLRFRINNGAETILQNESRILFTNPLTGHRIFGEVFIINETNREKLVTGHTTHGPPDPGVAPDRSENTGKWINPTGPNDQADRLRIGDEFENGKITNGSLKIWGAD